MRKLRLRSEPLPDLRPDDLARVAAAGPPTETKAYLVCVFTDGYECQSLFYECYSRGCTRQEG